MSARQPSSASWIDRVSAGYRKQHAAPLDASPETEALNARLNASETMLRSRIGDQKVDDLIVQFIEAGTESPQLFQELYAKRDPYRWLAQHWAPKQQPRSH